MKLMYWTQPESAITRVVKKEVKKKVRKLRGCSDSDSDDDEYDDDLVSRAIVWKTFIHIFANVFKDFANYA